MQVSLSVTVGRDATPGAKVRFWAIEAGAATPVSREAMQKIKLVLTPIDTQAGRQATSRCCAVARWRRASWPMRLLRSLAGPVAYLGRRFMKPAAPSEPEVRACVRIGVGK